MMYNHKMALSQLIYTSTCTAAMTPRMAYIVSEKSVDICKQLGLTGRVFANNKQALAMTEGPTEIVRRYYQAVAADGLVENIVLHTDREIKAREFSNYSVWLNLDTPINFTNSVCCLSEQTLPRAMPKNISVRLRMMVEAYVKPDLLHN